MLLTVLSIFILLLALGSFYAAICGLITRKTTFALNWYKYSTTYSDNPIAFVVIEVLYALIGVAFLWLGLSLYLDPSGA